MARRAWIVHPNDPDMRAKCFGNLWDARQWAAALCCNYWIEEVSA